MHEVTRNAKLCGPTITLTEIGRKTRCKDCGWLGGEIQVVKLTREGGQERLLVKAFAESVSFFQKVGFKPTDVLDYPHTLGMSL